MRLLERKHLKSEHGIYKCSLSYYFWNLTACFKSTTGHYGKKYITKQAFFDNQRPEKCYRKIDTLNI